MLSNPLTPTDVKDAKAGCPVAYRKLIEVIGHWMQQEYEGQSVILALDTEDNGINLPLSQSIADLLYKSEFGKKMKHIFPAPFWIDSQSMAGAQVADLIAHILMNSMMPKQEQKPLEKLWEQVDSLKCMWQDRQGSSIVRLKKS